MAFCLITKADHNRYSDFKTALENNFNEGSNQYPVDRSKALSMLKNHRSDKTKKNTKAEKSVCFTNNGNNIKNINNNELKKKATCHKCGKVGHIRPECPVKDNSTHNNVGSDLSSQTN